MPRRPKSVMIAVATANGGDTFTSILEQMDKRAGSTADAFGKMAETGKFQADRFEARASVSTWLLAIARNKAWSLLRKRRDAELDEDYAESLEDDADGPEIVLQKQDKGLAIRACLERLSAEHREVIDLVYYHETSVEEVARIVGIPENTVKTRLFHARKKLGEMLTAAGIDRGWP